MKKTNTDKIINAIINEQQPTKKYTIGELCYIDKNTVIGDGVRIGNGVVISNDSEHPCSIRIEQNAVIGSGSVIVNGITIARNAVILAGSLVDRDIPEGEIWGGNPIKRRIV